MSCCALACCECGACVACSCCQGALSAASRVGHFVLLGSVMGLAVVLGTYDSDSLNDNSYYSQIAMGGSCYAEYEDTCMYRQLIYRGSFALFLIFAGLAAGTFYSDGLNKGYWPLKFVAAFALFIGFWWSDDWFFNDYAEFTRWFSILWLLAQHILLLDFAHDIHDLIMGKAAEAEETEEGSGTVFYATYIILSLGFLALACLGLAYLFTDYSGCGGAFFIAVTLIFGIISILLSLWDAVNKGLLTPCIMFAYSVFMCWYSLLSSPEPSCNPTADTNSSDAEGDAVSILVGISAVAIIYCILNGTAILNAFTPEGEGVIHQYVPVKNSTNHSPLAPPQEIQRDEENDTAEDADETDAVSTGNPYERSFFHVLLLLLSIYLSMLLTNWGKPNGNVLSEGSDSVGLESMWLKIVSQWLFMAMYMKILHLAYLENQDGV